MTAYIDQDIEYRSYEGWKSIGFYVMKGEKSEARCPLTKVSLFGWYQVEEEEDIENWASDYQW